MNSYSCVISALKFLKRHAKSPFVLGQERARELSAQVLVDVKKVTDIMNNEEIDLIVSSPYTRAIQTIEEIATNKEKEIIVSE